ncbi:MAG: helix-turn-helix domain-containing protein [Candidatus Taylorbacteria bacterium]|nr:helix-turn-helix domain-containing protein [Candidatus Taylorbacteria bacterium]
MAKRREKDHNEAVKLRLEGQSYSQIKEKLGISKSTLSGWLDKYPLSPERLKNLQGKNPRRIESFRATMRRKREEKNQIAYSKIEADIHKLSRRELLIGGFFLYWGEGSKTSPGTVMISNTDPAVLRYFIRWIRLLKIPTEKMHVLLHLYKDMNIEKELRFWSKETGLPKSRFHRPWIKDSSLIDITYKNGFGHGTCHVRVYSRELYDYIKMGLKFIREKYAII